jgi:ankyrin repeat protein
MAHDAKATFTGASNAGVQVGQNSGTIHYNQLTATNQHERTPLHDAVAEGDESKVAQLLSSGAEINVYDPQGYSPLNLAIWNANDGMVKLLLENNASIESTSATMPPLHAAILNGNEHVAEILLSRGADIERRSAGQTALAVAASKGAEALVALLLKRGAIVTARNTHGLTPLFGAVRTGHTEVVKMLLEHGADFSEGDYSGQVLALIYRHQLLVTLFRTLGNRKMKDKMEAKELTDTIATIKLFGFDIEKDKDQALLKFAATGREEQIKLLIKRGASLAATDGSKTPLYKAVERRQINGVRLLLDAGADVSTRYPGESATILNLAVKRSSAALVNLLLNHGADPNANAHGGSPPLHDAARVGSAPIALLLLNAGASVEATDNYGHTAMHRACQVGSVEVMSLLRDRGAPEW